MAVIYQTVEDNTIPALTLTLRRGTTAIDLTTAVSVELIANNERTGAQTNATNETCGIVTPTSGIVQFVPIATDFPSFGRYICDVKINWPGGGVEVLSEQLLVVVRDKNTGS